MLQWPGRSDEVSKRINDEIKKENQLRAREVKKKERFSVVDKLNPFRTNNKHKITASLLILGSSCSGKSTIAKQMRVLLGGINEYERKIARLTVKSNVKTALKMLLNATRDMDSELLLPYKKVVDWICELEQQLVNNLTSQDFSDITSLLADPAIQQAFIRSTEYSLYSTASYFLNDLERISAPNYLPTQQDIIRAKTTERTDIKFEEGGIKFKVSERMKSVRFINDVTFILFVVGLSDYDLITVEDGVTNRMHESLKLFEEVCNKECFRETTIILLLNKKDVFKEMITKVNLNVCFEDYDGIGYEDGFQFVVNKFLALIQKSNKSIDIHIVNAIDTESVATIFNTVKDNVMNEIQKRAK